MVLAALDGKGPNGANANLARLSGESRGACVGRAPAIDGALDEHGSWMEKDPRLAILFPIWRQALDRPLCVLVWREPSAVSPPLATPHGLPIWPALPLWGE